MPPGIDLGDAWADEVWEDGVWADGVWEGQEASGSVTPNATMWGPEKTVMWGPMHDTEDQR